MRFEVYIPDKQLRATVSRIVISENPEPSTYRVFPGTGAVFGFQYSGQLSTVIAQEHTSLSFAGITGLTDSYRIFSNSPDIGTILVYFTEVGLSHFTRCPARHFFNQSLSLTEIFNREKVDEVTDRLREVKSDKQRIGIVEQFLLAELQDQTTDTLVTAAIRLIRREGGHVRIKDLSKDLYTSASVLERRFKQIVGVAPKKFASLVRLNKVIDEMKTDKPLISICYDNTYFDQAHFVKDFKRYTGAVPDNFRRLFK